jgi:hypothetical protein
MQRRLVGATVLTLLFVAHSAAQSPRAYQARLSWVPIDIALQTAVAGHGSAKAVLTGTTLTITGTFDGLRTPATVARLHRGALGIRGPAIADVTVTQAVKGEVFGTIELTAAQVDDLANRRLYLQIHSQKAPDGNLWGWLLPQEPRRR